jgi:formylglycine-generating enzyme required for sulfatase activity
VYAPGIPLPPPDPNPSSQIFKLPPRSTDEDPIRRRSEGKFPVGPVLVLLGGLFVVAVLGYAIYRVFVNQEPAHPDPFTNTFGMKMVRLEGGTFHMGSPDGEPGRRADEGPVREVTLRGPFFMSATEVTNGQFLKVMGVNPSRGAKMANRSEAMPVDSVTWDEANEFCRKLTERERGQPWMRKGWEYRLPTEAEWEYAARAGTDGPSAFGERLAFGTQAVFRSTGDDPVEGGEPGKSLPFAQETGKVEVNKFGLYDMHGNVAEWCSDWYRSEAYKDAAKENPTGPTEGDKRVIRGGSFRDPASAARSAAREGLRPTERRDTVGFRVVYAPVAK